MKNKTTRPAIPVNVPWTKKTWSKLRLAELLGTPEFSDFLNAWTKSLSGIRGHELSIKCIEQAATVHIEAGNSDERPTVKDMVHIFEHSPINGEIIAFMLESLTVIQGGVVPSIGSVEQTEMGLSIVPFVDHLLTSPEIHFKRGEKKKVRLLNEKARAGTCFYAVAVVNEYLGCVKAAPAKKRKPVTSKPKVSSKRTVKKSGKRRS